MKKKILVTIFILFCILLLVLFYYSREDRMLSYLYLYPITKNNIYDYYVYDVYSDHVTIVTYNGTDSDIKIPSYIYEKPVWSIEDSAFYGNSNIETVIIPNTVIKIGYQSFIGCENLKIIEIPTSVVSIGDSAFQNCPSLEAIYVNENSKAEKLLRENNYEFYIKYQ